MSILGKISQVDLLEWLGKLRSGEKSAGYKFSASQGATAFSACFALFLIDLFRGVEKFTQQEREEWISYIQSFQNKEYGYFEPGDYFLGEQERTRYQLTSFCLSAFRILSASPKYPLQFVRQWQTPHDIQKYLYQEGCHIGRGGSGNKAMFLAIFLTHEYERTKDQEFLQLLDAWFAFHDQAQNQAGFWGRYYSAYHYKGFQNGFHQLLVYFYWRKKVNKFERIVDLLLKIQNKNGSFTPSPFCGMCWEYDAAHILLNAFSRLDYRRDEIKKSLQQISFAIRSRYKKGEGFCQSRYYPRNLEGICQSLSCLIGGFGGPVWFYRLKDILSYILKKRDMVLTSWTKTPRRLDEANLWDTWLACLTLAEISTFVHTGFDFPSENIRFHEHIGIGYFNP